MKVTSIEPTPNPNALKFLVDSNLSTSGVQQFDNSEAGESSPLAKVLFAVDGVETVFYASQFVTVRKKENVTWNGLQKIVVQTIESFDPKQLKTAKNSSSAPAIHGSPPNKSELLEKINQVIDNNVRPPLEGDGGGIEVISLDGFVLSIHYQGACGGCPSSSQGTMTAIENLLRAMVDPRIQVVSS